MIGLLCLIYAMAQIGKWQVDKEFPKLEWWGWIVFVIGCLNCVLLLVGLFGNM